MKIAKLHKSMMTKEEKWLSKPFRIILKSFYCHAAGVIDKLEYSKELASWIGNIVTTAKKDLTLKTITNPRYSQELLHDKWIQTADPMLTVIYHTSGFYRIHKDCIPLMSSHLSKCSLPSSL